MRQISTYLLALAGVVGVFLGIAAHATIDEVERRWHNLTTRIRRQRTRRERDRS